MPCIPVPHIPNLPSLGPFTLGITTPPINLGINLCCKIPILNIPAIPLSVTLPIPGVVAVVIAAIKLAIDTINAFIDALPFDCPLE